MSDKRWTLQIGDWPNGGLSVRPVATGDCRMALEDSPVPAKSAVSRRTVFRTAAKLAYAAPVVAASLHVGKYTTAAISAEPTPTCTPDGDPCEFADPGACCSLACGAPGFGTCPDTSPTPCCFNLG